MRPPLRRLMLVAHIGFSVGWLGAVAGSLALSVIGLVARDPAVVRAVYLVLEPVGWSTLVPLSFASLLTGLVQAWGTRWGLIRHYWVLIKLVMNVFATTILLLYMQTLGYLAGLARTAVADGPAGDLRSPSPVAHAAAAIVLLLTALVLSVYKPRGETSWVRPAGTRRGSAPVRGQAA
jgi:hypothetical protein